MRTVLLLGCCALAASACGGHSSAKDGGAGGDSGEGGGGGGGSAIGDAGPWSASLNGGIAFVPQAAVWGYRFESDGSYVLRDRTLFLFSKPLPPDCSADPFPPFQRVALSLSGPFDGGDPNAALTSWGISYSDFAADGAQQSFEDSGGSTVQLQRADDQRTQGSFVAPQMLNGVDGGLQTLSGSFDAPFCPNRQGR